MDTYTKKHIVIHDDFFNFLWNTPGVEDPANLAKAAGRELESKADIISLCVAMPEICLYYPAQVGEVLGSNGEGNLRLDVMMRALTTAGVDPFGVVVDRLRRDGCSVLAKVRVSDCHHVAGFPQWKSQFWQQHPEWRIGNIEAELGGEVSFSSSSRVGPTELERSIRDRGQLLDYAVPQVREHRLSVIRDFMQRYDVDGLTLNFLRTPYCISFPSKNAPLLTEFVAQCRHIVNETVGQRGKAAPVLGAVMPWDVDYCREMGLDIEKWIAGELLDYVSPTGTWVTEFNMPIEPWVSLASSTRCAVYPGIVGLTSSSNDVCLPEEYEMEEWPGIKGERRQGSSKVTPENVRALAHGFYAEGADGVSFFNLYSAYYRHLYPLSDICLPNSIKGKERRYIYMKRATLVGEATFLQIVLTPGSSERKVVPCRLHENLKEADACVRFKARGLADVGSLSVGVNSQEVPVDSLSLIPHAGQGFLYAQFPLRESMLRDGANEIGFAFRDGGATVKGDVIIQEVEVRVVPR